MPRIPRKWLIDVTEVGVYHCISRCVRRAFLCGVDQVSGRNFDHRKQWIQDRLEFLAGQFGIDVLGFGLMSNHIHLILRNRPDVVRGWSDDEVARRWWNLFPQRTDAEGRPADPQESDLAMITRDASRLEEIGRRLSSLSWFMRCVAEPIARRANREDKCTGRFWEGRYKCQPILDESALLACLAYVDLNPIRAGIAHTPETSRFTSVFERIQALLDAGERLAGTLEAAPVPAVNDGTEVAALPAAAGDGSAQMRDQQPCPRKAPRDAWLSPFSLGECDHIPVPPQRASNKGCLEISFGEYLRLLDWTGRMLRSGKRGSIPVHLAPLLTRLHVSEEGWLKLVTGFSRIFRRAAGTPMSLQRDAAKHGKRRREGIAQSAALFA